MFDPAGHAVLSAGAASLGADALVAQARIAERLLRVDPAAYDGLSEADQEVWGQMVCLQINYQLERPEAYRHRGFGDVQETYPSELLSAAAVAIRDSHFADGTGAAVSGGSWSMDAVYDPEDEE